MPGNAPGRGTSELEHAIPLPELLAFAFGPLLPLLAAALVLLPVPCRRCRCRSGQGKFVATGGIDGNGCFGQKASLPSGGSRSEDLHYKGIALLWHPDPLSLEGLKGAGGKRGASW